MVLESDDTRSEIPLLFVQGIFSEDAELMVQAMETVSDLPEDGKLLEAWRFHVSESEHQNQLRLQLPDVEHADKIGILIRGEDGAWRSEEYELFGRYAVVKLNAYDNAVALIQQPAFPWLTVAVIFAAIMIVAGICCNGYIKKKKEQ
jgi:hypothetical protein